MNPMAAAARMCMSSVRLIGALAPIRASLSVHAPSIVISMGYRQLSMNRPSAVSSARTKNTNTKHSSTNTNNRNSRQDTTKKTKKINNGKKTRNIRKGISGKASKTTRSAGGFGASYSPFDLVCGRYNPPQAMSRRSARRWARVAPLIRVSRKTDQVGRGNRGAHVSKEVEGRGRRRGRMNSRHAPPSSTSSTSTLAAPAFNPATMIRKTFVVGPDSHESKLIEFIQKAAGMDRLQALRKIDTGLVWVSGSSHAPFVKLLPAGILHAGDVVNVAFQSRLLKQQQQNGVKNTAAGGATADASSSTRDANTATDVSIEAAVEELRSRILYKDEHIYVINKAQGMASQGGSGIGDMHLDSLMGRLESDGSKTPRLVHRLDKNTSGAMIIARTKDAARRMGELFQQNGMISRRYVAIVSPMESGGSHLVGEGEEKRNAAPAPTLADLESGERTTLTTGIVANGLPAPHEKMQTVEWLDGDDRADLRSPTGAVIRKAVTHAWVLGRSDDGAASVLCLDPATGRKHQLRLHCASVLRAGILGDYKYGDGCPAAMARRLRSQQNVPLHLHLHRIVVRDYYGPGGGDLAVVAPIPPHLRRTIQSVGMSVSDVSRLVHQLE